MDHMRLHPMRTKPARQPEAVSTSFEGQCNPRGFRIISGQFERAIGRHNETLAREGLY
jgi:hypothetical protein